MNTTPKITPFQNMDLSTLRRHRATAQRLHEVVDFIAKDAPREVDAKIKSMPLTALKDDLDMLVWFRKHVPGEYLAACHRAHGAHGAADLVPLLRLMHAAGAQPDFHVAQSILLAEMPLVESELTTIAALTLFYSGEASGVEMRSQLLGESLVSLHFDRAQISNVVNFFGARRYAN